jgi:hypothetical protein
MPITLIHDRSSEESPEALVVRALREAALLAPADIVLQQVSGANLQGRYTRWWEWSLAAGGPEVVVPSILGEGDPDDAPFRASGGFLVIPEGFATAYVHMFRPEDTDRLRARIRVAELAASDLGAPRGACDPVDPALVELCARVAKGLARPGSVFATRSWVQVDPIHGGMITIEQDPGGFRVMCLVESYVDLDGGVPPSDEDRDALDQLARRALDEELTPRLEGLGMRCTPGACWGGEEDRHGGCAVEQWEKVVADADAVIVLVRAIDAESCRREGLTV